MVPLNQKQKVDLTHILEYVPVSVAIHDSLNSESTFIEHEDPKFLVDWFIDELEKRWKKSRDCTLGLMILTCC